MFDTLLETRAVRTRTWRGHSLSVVMHAGIIAFAIVATKQIAPGADAPRDERVLYATPPEAPPPPPPPAPRTDVPAAPPIAKGFQVLVAPIDIPDQLPPIDLSKPITDEANFSGRNGIAGGVADGVAGAPPRALNTDATYFGFQVEKQAALIPGTGQPEYPAALRDAGIGGEVRISFVVDSLGVADMRTLRVLATPHPAFADAVRKALARAKFFAAEIGGRRVRQQVEMPYVFSLTDR